MDQQSDRDGSVVPRAVIELHLQDEPAQGRRERLLRQLERAQPNHEAAASSDGQSVLGQFRSWRREGARSRSAQRFVEGVEGVEGVDPCEPSRGRSRLAGLAAAMTGLILPAALLIWAAQGQPAGRNPSAEHNPAEPSPAAKPLIQAAPLSPPSPPADAPCFRARGGPGSLFDGARASGAIAPLDGRRGLWLHHRAGPAGDQRSAPLFIAAPPGAAGKRFAMQAQGESSVGWGAKLATGLRTTLLAADRVRFDCYDASAYAGIRFRARGEGIVLVLTQTKDAVPPELGGTCRSKCWFGGSHAIALTEEARDYHLGWERFSTPEGSGAPESELMLVEFLVQAKPEPYAIVLEEVAFMTHEEAGQLGR